MPGVEGEVSRITRGMIETWWKGAQNPNHVFSGEEHTHCGGTAPEAVVEKEDRELLTFEMEGSWYTMWTRDTIGFVRH